jgi:hypothetical protein
MALLQLKSFCVILKIDSNNLLRRGGLFMVSPAPSGDSTSTSLPLTDLNSTATTPTAPVSDTTTISSLAELQKVSPKGYNSMLQGMAMEMCSQMKRQQDHLKEIGREARAS